MSFIPGLNVIIEKIPELLTPRGILRAVATFLGLFLVALFVLLWLDGHWPLGAVVAQLVIYGVLHWLLRAFFQGREERLSYDEAFFNRFLISAALNLASILYILMTHGGAVLGATRLVPGWLGWLGGLYLLASAALLFVRGIRAAGVDTLAGVYIYYPNEGRRIEDSVYKLLRHPVYAAMDRVALAFGLINGTPFALLLAVFFIAVWHPRWYGLEERELVSRFGDEYRAYAERVPATMPGSLTAEVALWETLTRRVVKPADGSV
jgi:protein-S-isoprenylcysteine O-methyltransferase Ste14